LSDAEAKLACSEEAREKLAHIAEAMAHAGSRSH